MARDDSSSPQVADAANNALSARRRRQFASSDTFHLLDTYICATMAAQHYHLLRVMQHQPKDCGAIMSGPSDERLCMRMYVGAYDVKLMICKLTQKASEH